MATQIRRQPRRFTAMAVTAILFVGVLLAIHPGRACSPPPAATRTGSVRHRHESRRRHRRDDARSPKKRPSTSATASCAHAQTFNGTDPRPDVPAQRRRHGDRPLREPPEHARAASTGTGSSSRTRCDGTPFTQNQVPPGGNFLYKFKVTRPGIFWYHPHHHASTNQVFKGLYGMIVVTGPQRGRAAAPRGRCRPRPDAADRPQRHHGVQGAGRERRARL